MITIDAQGIHIGILYFRFYGMIIMFGAVMAAWLAQRMLRKMGQDPEMVWDGFFWVIIFGIIGARIYHVLTPSKYSGITTEYYLHHPLQILKMWDGGLGMPGAIIGGAIGIYIFAKRRGISFAMLLDAAAPGVALAQAIGRWGNFVNQELYGQPTDVPWCIKIDPAHRLPGYGEFDCFHPLFLYESIWNLLNMFFLLWLFRKYRKNLINGDLFLVYMITYPIGRFLLEYLRLDYVQIAGINFNQALMLVVAILVASFLVIRHRRKPKTT
ncbi:MAG: prolipoprotein diacylglyceryl transferase [Anaerolineales bacterium]|jgi:phosphatidylglycerol:prolipoprotein diacylglycerol transferase